MVRRLSLTVVGCLFAASCTSRVPKETQDVHRATAASSSAPPSCRPGAYASGGGGLEPLYVVGDLLVGGDSTVAGYVRALAPEPEPKDVLSIEVMKAPEAVARDGCRARAGAIVVELEPGVRDRLNAFRSAPDATTALHWFAGRWERRAGSLTVEEQWLAPRGGVLLGVSRTTRGDSLVEFEFMRIHARGDTLVLAAHPSGQAPAEFRARATTVREVVFENPAHDFPQRIRYRAVGADSLLARIEGTRGGRTRGVDFGYGRTACPTASPAR
jgi:hypothetical protein